MAAVQNRALLLNQITPNYKRLAQTTAHALVQHALKHTVETTQTLTHKRNTHAAPKVTKQHTLTAIIKRALNYALSYYVRDPHAM